MGFGEIEIRDTRSLAERNEEINRRRAHARPSAGGPLKVTDPEAFARLCREMQEHAKKQREIEAEREREREKREGSNYRTPEEREKAARLAKLANEDGEETKVLHGKFDPYKNYYQILGIDHAASAVEIKKAYKKLALAYHPDKHANLSKEQRAAVHKKFQQVLEAFDVLTDEEVRVVYDRVRDYMHANGGKALPRLSARESALMSDGIAELSKLRRQGLKLRKHDPTEVHVDVSLEKLNAGSTKTVVRTRRRVDEEGRVQENTKNFHLIIRKGSFDGMRLVFEGEGDEHIDTHPGDLVFILKKKPHGLYKQAGEKDLEIRGPAAEPHEVVYHMDIRSLYGRTRTVVFYPILESLMSGGCGGVWEKRIIGQGLYDPQDPWEGAKGDLIVKVRFPPFILGDRFLTSPLRLVPIITIGKGDDVLCGSMAAAVLKPALREKMDAQEMLMDYRKEPQPPSGVVIVSTPAPSPAAVLILDVISAAFPKMQWIKVFVNPQDGIVTDDELCGIFNGDVVLVDTRSPSFTGPPAWQMARENEWHPKEEWIRNMQYIFSTSGIQKALWVRRWLGAHVIAIADGCSLLGAPAKPAEQFVGGTFSRPHLPFVVRTGGGQIGWSQLHAAVLLAGGDEGKEVEGVGVSEGSLLEIDGVSFEADELMAPPRQTLMEMAAACASGYCLTSCRYDDVFDDLGLEDKGFHERCLSSHLRLRLSSAEY